MADADTKPKQVKMVKKENGEVEERKVLANGGMKEVLSKTVKIKKEERTTSETLNDVKVKKKSTTIATKKKKKEVAQKKLSQDGKGAQKEKKIYELPGQRHDPPEERDPLRIFYETLYEQLPTSDMAAFWLMERGLLPEDVAQKLYEKKLKKNGQQKVGTPVKAVTVKKIVKSVEKKISASKTEPKKASSASKTEPKVSKKRKPDTSDSDDDFIVSKVVKKDKPF